MLFLEALREVPLQMEGEQSSSEIYLFTDAGCGPAKRKEKKVGSYGQ